MTVHQRQLDELRSLSRAGRLGRAVDLAFEHFARFGRDEQVVAWLVEACRGAAVPHELRRRLDELAAGSLTHDE